MQVTEILSSLKCSRKAFVMPRKPNLDVTNETCALFVWSNPAVEPIKITFPFFACLKFGKSA